MKYIPDNEIGNTDASGEGDAAAADNGGGQADKASGNTPAGSGQVKKVLCSPVSGQRTGEKSPLLTSQRGGGTDHRCI